MGRPKGRNYVPVSLSVTPEHRDFLNNQPNASELIRKLLDDLVASRENIEEKFNVISLNNQLEMLEEEKQKLTSEKHQHLWLTDWKNVWKTKVGSDGNTYVDWKDTVRWIPKPLDDNEDSQVAFRVLMEYDRAIEDLEQKIAEIKRQILESE